MAQSNAKAAFNAWKTGEKSYDSSHPLRASYKEAKRIFRAKLRYHRKDLKALFYDNLDSNCSESKKLFAQICHFLGKSDSFSESITVDGSVYAGDSIWEGWVKYSQKLLSPIMDDSLILMSNMKSTCLIPWERSP